MAKISWDLKGNEGDTPYEVYRRTVSEIRARDARWKYMALGSAAMLCAAIATLIYTATLPRTVPLVISVNDFGEAKYVGEATKLSYTGMKIPEIAIEYQIRKFINNKYAVPADAQILRQHLTDCYSCLTPESGDRFTQDLRDDDPRRLLGESVRTVQVETILKLSDSSYQADFYVTRTDMAGAVKDKQRVRGVLTLAFLEPDSSDKVLNPLGIYITNYDFTVVEITKR